MSKLRGRPCRGQTFIARFARVSVRPNVTRVHYILVLRRIFRFSIRRFQFIYMFHVREVGATVLASGKGIHFAKGTLYHDFRPSGIFHPIHFPNGGMIATWVRMLRNEQRGGVCHFNGHRLCTMEYRRLTMERLFDGTLVRVIALYFR